MGVSPSYLAKRGRDGPSVGLHGSPFILFIPSDLLFAARTRCRSIADESACLFMVGWLAGGKGGGGGWQKVSSACDTACLRTFLLFCFCKLGRRCSLGRIQTVQFAMCSSRWMLRRSSAFVRAITATYTSVTRPVGVDEAGSLSHTRNSPVKDRLSALSCRSRRTLRRTFVYRTRCCIQTPVGRHSHTLQRPRRAPSQLYAWSLSTSQPSGPNNVAEDLQSRHQYTPVLCLVCEYKGRFVCVCDMFVQGRIVARAPFVSQNKGM